MNNTRASAAAPSRFSRPIGAHMSIAGGVENAVFHGRKLGCGAVQIFTKSNNQWNAKPITPDQKAAFRKAIAETGVSVPLSHCAYLINLASPDEATRQRSLRAMEDEMKRARLLEIPYLVLHPGSHTGSGVEQGVKKIAEAINALHEKLESPAPVILLETMAGQGSSIGSTFEELEGILQHIRDRSRIGICIDTCHIFAAGYDIRTPDRFADVLDRFDRIVGLEQVKAFHLNDSKKELGCRVDRHEHIGKGCIGTEAFRYLLSHPCFANIPMILETPKGEDDTLDLMNLETLASFLTTPRSTHVKPGPQTTPCPHREL